MNILVSQEWVVFTFLVFVRLGTFFMFAPVFNFVKLPVNIRIVFSFVLALFFSSILGEIPAYEGGFLSFAGWIIVEIVNGAALSFGMVCAFAVFHFAGRILDFQMGFGVAGLIDPATNIQAPMIGTMMNLLAIIVFVLAGGVTLVFRTLHLSLLSVPPGTAFQLQTPLLFIAQAGLIFSRSVSLVAPVMIAVFLLDIVMAFAGRTMPQMNVFILSIPAKIALGLSILAATIVYSQPLVRRIYESIFQFWEPLIHG